MPRWPKKQPGEKAPMSHGVGESKPFIAPAGTFPENKILDCHVGGVLVRDLPVEIQGRILYRQTDEGIAELNEGKVERRASVISDPLDKIINAPSDLEPWEAQDPMKELAQRYVPPDMSPKFLDPGKCDKDGMRGFEVVKDQRGDPVKLGTLMLGQMPRERARRRNAAYQQKAADDAREIHEEFQVKQERLLGDAGLRPGEVLHDVRGPESGVIGLHSERGQ